MKIHPVGAKLFHADTQTDGRTKVMTKLIVAFRSFCEKRLIKIIKKQRKWCQNVRKIVLNVQQQ